jgi:hypothetical protein
MKHQAWGVGLWGLCLLGLLLRPVSAAPKVIVQVGLPFWCTVEEGADKNGTFICVRLDLYPFTQNPVGLTEHVARLAPVVALASESCAALKNLVINRMAVEFPTVTVVAEEIWMHGCVQ